ncbi:MAG: hypothetical protein PWP37_1655 [Thermotogota bacterium]|nr:hypothetical protein [Thermotogota bacterium]MDK2865463.1 hypothetical protein [Thermotogota bacterium]
MAAEKLKAVLVTENGRFVGVVHEDDILLRLCTCSKKPSPERVEEIMTRDIPSISPEDDLEHAEDLMRKYNLKFLPVVENGKTIGVITFSDLIRATYEEAGNT